MRNDSTDTVVCPSLSPPSSLLVPSTSANRTLSQKNIILPVMKLTGLGLLGLLPVGVPASEAIGQGGRTPCSGDFKPPVYEFNDFSVTASLYKGGGEPMGLLNINFTMRDLANDVVLWCNWTITKMSSYGDDDWYDVEDICTSDGRFKTDFRTQSYISVESFSIDEGKQGPISIVQFWYCERDDGSYPYVF